ncbi:hypothetical protein FDUTEX481_01497 [Tolypothrix sp. PCC 7601]|nr:hypothetical protein FDUTEX481_01497 [Tolypothrix sp. PCC 7601]
MTRAGSAKTATGLDKFGDDSYIYEQSKHPIALCQKFAISMKFVCLFLAM